MNPAIRVSNISKRYRINHATTRGDGDYRTLRESLTSALTAPWRRLRNPSTPGKIEDFWALRDITFDVEPGEVIGIIGRNGAGKSTLLKILTRITDPTEGRAEISGRVGSLLEVGTGFHPELSGRENIFLNGSILGMSSAEIRKNFDEIVEFSGVEQFLDTPVKRYSSGMRVRLAFSVAAHLNPEILLIDEVLAVGDADFQRRCLGKMEALGHSGRTVVVVSHNMPTIQALCSRAIWIKQGRIQLDTVPTECVQGYLSDGRGQATYTSLNDRQDRPGDGAIRFRDIWISGPQGENSAIYMGDDIHITIAFDTNHPLYDCNVGIHIYNTMRQIIYRIITRDTLGSLPAVTHNGRIKCIITNPRLLPGNYEVYLIASSNTGLIMHDELRNAARFDVEPADVYGTGKIPQQGILYPECRWELTQDGS